MKYLYFFLVLLFYHSCTISQKNQSQIPKVEEIEKITLADSSLEIEVDSSYWNQILSALTFDNEEGLMKFKPNYRLVIHQTNQDSTVIRIGRNSFKYGLNDIAYQTNLDSTLFIEIVNNFIFSNADLLEKWKYLIHQEGGCLTGGQFDYSDRKSRESGVLKNNEKWQTFLQIPPDELTQFLVQRLADTTTTSIHTCPFFLATEGELAVYNLQQIYKKSWFDFAAFSEYKGKQSQSSTDNHQAWLKAILANDERRELLIKYW